MNPEWLIERVKNFMGDPNYRLSYHGQEFSPAAISKIILMKLVADAKTALSGEEIEGAVVTVPAYFGDAARRATKLAAEEAGLKVYQIMDEPNAALFAYAHNQKKDMQERVLIYDLGGGTFDCTVAKISINGDNTDLELITSGGDHQLGGKDWDEKIKEYFISEFCSRTGASADDMRSDPEMRAFFSEQTEKVKIMLSGRETASMTINYASSRERIDITREKFETITEDLLNQTMLLVEKMFGDKGLDIRNDVDKIILVGGSTKMPQVKRRLELEYGKDIIFYEPDKAVAMGAALLASKSEFVQETNEITGETVEVVSTDLEGDGGGIRIVGGGEGICTKSYGLIAYRGNERIVSNIIMKDSPRPASATKEFGTHAAAQSSVLLEVYENTCLDDACSEGESQKLYEECSIPLRPGLPVGAPLQITFNLDSNGIINITLFDVTNGVTEYAVSKPIGGDSQNIGMDVKVALSN
jgi:molecular chaperone DnaK (HSP70)